MYSRIGFHPCLTQFGVAWTRIVGNLSYSEILLIKIHARAKPGHTWRGPRQGQLLVCSSFVILVGFAKSHRKDKKGGKLAPMRTRTIPHLWLLGVLTSSKSRQFLFDFFWTPCADSLSKCPFFSAIASADIEYYRHVIFDNSLTPDTCFYSSAIANGHDTSKCAPSAMAIGKGLGMGSRGAGGQLS